MHPASGLKGHRRKENVALQKTGVEENREKAGVKDILVNLQCLELPHSGSEIVHCICNDEALKRKNTSYSYLSRQNRSQSFFLTRTQIVGFSIRLIWPNVSVAKSRSSPVYK